MRSLKIDLLTKLASSAASIKTGMYAVTATVTAPGCCLSWYGLVRHEGDNRSLYVLKGTVVQEGVDSVEGHGAAVCGLLLIHGCSS